MAKVITERQRSRGDGGKSIPPKGTKKRLRKELANDGELSRKFESSARHRVYGWNAKEFGELLGPLRGFLLSRVGKRWDDVYSEVCQHIDKGSVTQKHILTHLFDYIALNVFIKDGKIYNANAHERFRKYSEIDQPTYVDPDSGLVCRTPVRPKRKKKNKLTQDYVRIDDLHCYYKYNGIWYRLDFRKLSERTECFGGYDILYHKHFAWSTWRTKIGNTVFQYNNRRQVAADFVKLYGSEVYCVGKQQINKSQIRKLKKEHKNAS